MYTSIMLLALSGVVGVADDAAPAWTNDYSAALKQGESQNKPLAVFLAPGDNGWDKLSKEGSLDNQVKQVLVGKYVPVFVNTDTDSGKQLAKAFGMPGGKGIVFSDRTGKLQAFWHEGDLANPDLARYLERYSDPQRVVRTTETNPSHQVSCYGGPGGDCAGGHCAPMKGCGPGGCGPMMGYCPPSGCHSSYGYCGSSGCGGGRRGGRCR